MSVPQNGQLSLDALPFGGRVGLKEEVFFAVLTAVGVVGWGWRFWLVVFDRLDLEAELFEGAGELALLARVFCSVFVLGLHLYSNELLDFGGQVFDLLARGLEGFGELLVVFAKPLILLLYLLNPFDELPSFLCPFSADLQVNLYLGFELGQR